MDRVFSYLMTRLSGYCAPILHSAGLGAQWFKVQGLTLNPKPFTLNPKTLSHPKPETPKICRGVGFEGFELEGCR